MSATTPPGSSSSGGSSSGGGSGQSPQQKLQTLAKAATQYFTQEKLRLNAQWSFLDAISQKRGGSVGLQDANAQGASQVLVDSIDEYLGRPIGSGSG